VKWCDVERKEKKQIEAKSSEESGENIEGDKRKGHESTVESRDA
jgi:hypothetical protein